MLKCDKQHESTEKYFTNIQITQLHKSTVFVMLTDVKMPTIVDILTFMSMTSFMNVLRLILPRLR